MDFEVRENRSKSRGRRKLGREREAYFDLVRQGVSSQEACRIVGVNVRTGKKWRNGHHSPGKGRKAVLSEVAREIPIELGIRSEAWFGGFRYSGWAPSERSGWSMGEPPKVRDEEGRSSRAETA